METLLTILEVVATFVAGVFSTVTLLYFVEIYWDWLRKNKRL